MAITTTAPDACEEMDALTVLTAHKDIEKHLKTKRDFAKALRKKGYPQHAITESMEQLANVSTIGMVGPEETVLGLTYLGKGLLHFQCANNTEFTLTMDVRSNTARGYIPGFGWIEDGFYTRNTDNYVLIYYQGYAEFIAGFRIPPKRA